MALICTWDGAILEQACLLQNKETFSFFRNPALWWGF